MHRPSNLIALNYLRRAVWAPLLLAVGCFSVGCGSDEFSALYPRYLTSSDVQTTDSNPNPGSDPGPNESGQPLQLQSCTGETVIANYYPPQRVSQDASGRATGLANGLRCKYPVLSEDGSRLFFASDGLNLLRGKRKRTVTHSGSLFEIILSKDLVNGSGFEAALPWTGSEVVDPYVGNAINVSSDGKLAIVYGDASAPDNPLNGKFALYLRKGDSPTELLFDGNFDEYCLSSSGNVLYYSTPNGRVWQIDLSTKAQREITTGYLRAFRPGANCSSDGRFLLLVPSVNAPSSYVVFDTLTGSTKPLPLAEQSQELSLSSDGRFLGFDTKRSLVPEDTNGVQDCYRMDLANDTLELVSQTEAGAIASADSSGLLLSADGRFALFQSSAPLLSGDTNNRLDLYQRDMQEGTLRRVTPQSSLYSGLIPILSEMYTNFHSAPYYTMSGDGSLVAFTSDLPDITPGDDNNGVDVFTWKRANGLVTRETISATGENGHAPGASLNSTTNFDGSKVAFATTSIQIANVINRSIQELGNVGFLYSESFVIRWSSSGQVDPAHVDSSGRASGNYAFQQADIPAPAIDGAGGRILYSWPVTKDPNIEGVDMFLRDFSAAASMFLGQAIGTDSGQRIPDVVRNCGISLDGLFLAFLKGTSGGQGGNLILRDAQNSSEETIAPGPENDFPRGCEVDLNADGSMAVFDTDRKLVPEDQNSYTDVYLWNKASRTYRLIGISDPRDVGTGRGRGSLSPAISADGKWVAFRAEFPLRSDKTGKAWDVYLYDVESNVLKNITFIEQPSVIDNLQSSPFRDNRSFAPSRDVDVSGDGRYVCFVSYYGDLSGDDTNGLDDVYVYDRERCVTCLVTRGTDLKSTEGASLTCSISTDGKWIVFDSDSADLVPNDDNQVSDVFRIRNPLYVASP